jgi:hypothetical protein
MSHVAEIDLHITDLDAAAKAAESIGCELLKNKTSFKTYQRGLTCEHVISVKNNNSAYQAGLQKRTDGKPGYKLVFDNYGMAGKMLQDKIGVAGNNFKDHYGAQVAAKELRKQGFRVQFQNIPTGGVRVTCNK